MRPIFFPQPCPRDVLKLVLVACLVYVSLEKGDVPAKEQG